MINNSLSQCVIAFPLMILSLNVSAINCNEEITELSIYNRVLTIKVTRYIGGYFSEQHTRKLDY
jgi:hypothetical protein